MRFSFAAISLTALLAQQVVAIAIPVANSEDLEARAQGRQGGGQGGGRGGRFGGGGGRFGGNMGAGGQGGNKGAAGGGQSGNKATGGNAGKGSGGNAGKGTAAGAAVGAAGAGAAIAAGGGKSATQTTTTAAAIQTTPPPPPGAQGSNAGLSAAQVTALQTSTTLDKTQIQPGLAQNGQATPEAGQVPSLTSLNNFVNFCATQNGVPLTNGQQIKTGSCNPTIMGRIISTDKMVSSKFVSPKNLDTIPANKDFTVTMAISNMVTGNFVAAQTNYFAAPCQVDGSGTVIGHSHIVIEKMTSLTQTTPTNPNVFAFFKGLNAPAQNGQLTATVTGGLAPGVYRAASINTCANHQPVLSAVAQHGSNDDQIYFTVQ